MTDNEIIEAFEVKVNLIGSMTSVYLDENEGQALYDVMDDARLLINRQKAEIERLTHNLEAMAQTMPNMAKAERAEAVKEFAERLKEKAQTMIRIYGYIGEAVLHGIIIIDNLVKEMAGDTQSEQ